MERGKGIERKVRSDKKVDVKPTMSSKLKNEIYSFAHYCEEPVKDVGERLCVEGAVSRIIIEEIHHWFRRDYFLPPAIHKGYLDRPRLKLLFKGETGKVTIKFKQDDFEKICNLSYALDLPPTTTCAILLKRTIHNQDFMVSYVHSHFNHLSKDDQDRVKRYLRKIWGYQ